MGAAFLSRSAARLFMKTSRRADDTGGDGVTMSPSFRGLARWGGIELSGATINGACVGRLQPFGSGEDFLDYV